MSEYLKHDPDQLHLFSIQETQAPIQYEIVNAHHKTNKEYRTTEQIHTRYITLTDELVRKATEGVEAVSERTGEVSIERPDYFIWLDKSARPLSWLTKDLWPVLAQNADGSIPKMPESKFVNIDRNQWTSSIDPNGVGHSNVDNIDPSIIRSLRSIFLQNPNDRDAGLTEAIDTAPTLLDGKTVLIVDELHSSGRTLKYSEQFFKRAFPDAKVAGAHWMGGMTSNKSGAIGNAETPVWYSDTTELGRGIGNRNIDLSGSSKNPTQRLGAYFLSNALKEPDSRSIQLRRELHQLAEDARSGKVLVVPSTMRELQDYDERAMRLNKVGSIDEYAVLKHSLDISNGTK